MDKSKYRLLYFIPPELRKHVEFVKGLPRIIADTVTDPNTYATLNQMLNPVEWVIAPVRNTRKFIDSGYKDVGALTNATIETLGLAAGPLAHKYASTLSPVASKGVSSGVKSLQELVMPLGASDDVAEKISKKTGVNRRQFIAGTAALGAASGLKGVGDIFPTPKVIKATAKSPILKSITRLSKLNKKFKETSNEISDPQMAHRYFRNKEEALKEQNEILEQEENLGNVLSSINQEFKDLENNILEKGYEGVSKLTKEELINLRKLFTDSYSIDRRFTAPDSYTRGYERSVVVTDEMGNKKLSNFVPVNDIINKALKEKGLTDLDTFVKIRQPITTKYSNDPMYENGIKTRKDAEKLGVEDEYIYGLDDRIIGSKTTYRIRDKIPEINIGNEKSITQRITEVNEQTEQALTEAADKLTKGFNQGGLPKDKKLTSNPFKAPETLKRLKNALRNAPVIGTVADVVDIGKDVATGDYAGAAVKTGTALAGVTPIGRIASKGAKVIGKKLKKLSKVDESKDSLKAINLTEKDLENWKKDPNNITSTEFKKKLEGREEELQNIAKSYKDNPTDETLDLYRRKVTELNPIKKIETMPDKPSFLDVRGALGIKVDSLAGKKTGIIGLNRNIEDGQRIASRLDINGYTNHNKWVATLTIPKNLIRDWVSKNPTLSPTSYATAVRLKNVDLKQTESLQKKSLDIAAGRAKGPHAVMEGDYSADDPDDIYKYAREIFESKDKDWIQVGYNPTRAGFFYDRGTGLPIESADEILQVGPLVLAKNAIGGSIRDYMYNKGGLTTDKQTQQAFNQGGINMEQQMSLFDEGGMKDDGLDRDPVSGNEIPPGSLAKEVRDDIPAQLSEGEYVVPADVVQYYGVKFFEDLRMEAKRGLAEMEATGRIGGEPMSMTMIAIGGAEEEQKERQKKALGGIIKADEGVLAKDMSNIEKYRSFNPYNFGVVGGTPFSPIAQTGQSMGLTTADTHSKMFYHPDGRVQAVPGRMVTVNGEQKFLPNPQYIEFTTGEWSDTPPSQTKAQTTETPKEDRDDSGKSSFDFEAQRLQNENSLRVSAERLELDPKVYAGLGFFKRFKLMGEEIKAMRGQEIDKDKINSIVNDTDEGSSFDLRSILKTVTTFGFLATGNPLIPLAARIIAGISTDSDKKKDVKPTTITTSTSKITPDPKPFSEADYEKSTPMGQQASYEEAAGITSKPKTTAKTKTPSAKAKETFREKEAKGLTKSIGTAGGSKTAKDFEDPSDNFAGMINKGGLINKPKRNPKKPRGKGLGSK